eukprot:g10749.t1
MEQARAQGMTKTRRLQLQCADSTRRLQELLHECVGEYEKARLRGLRRRRLSAEACDSVLAAKILDLRWSRFCSRLEEDALGLLSARDMGNPTLEGGYGHNAVSSSSSCSTAATATVASLLVPALARSGLGDCRILRIVALCPCSGGGEGGRDNSRSSRELERSSLSNGTTATPGFGRLPHSEQRRGNGRGAGGGVRGGGVVEALREELRCEGAVAPGSEAVVLDAGAENSPLGVADVFRKAVLCRNGGLIAALSSRDGAVHGHRKHSNGNISDGHGVGPAEVFWPRRSSVLPVVGPQGKSGDKELSAATRRSVPQIGHRNCSAGGCSGSDSAEGGFGSSTRCVVGGAEPGLLLSSSHLLWALRPSFGDYNSAYDRTGKDADGVDGNGKPDREDCAGEDPTEASGRLNHDVDSGDVGARNSIGVDSSRQERLNREVAWIGAAPVGSRVYYCLEEAEWEASRRRDGHASSQPHAVSTLRFEDSAPLGSSRRRRRPRSGEDGPRSGLRHIRVGETSPSSGDDRDDANSEEEGERARQFGSERGLRQEDDQEVGTAHDRHKVAAMTFARSVSSMLAKVYLAPKPQPCTNPEPEGRADGEDGSGGNGSRAQAPAAWPSRKEGKASAGSGFASEVTTAAATLVVSGVTDAHRRSARSKAGFDGDERLAALAAVPDVLVAVDRPELRGQSHGRSTKETPADTPPLHFAPAGVLQLVGTPHFREFVEALPPAARTKLLKLYPESSIRAVPVGQLYVALAPALQRGTVPSVQAVVSSAAPAEYAPWKGVEQEQGARQQPDEGGRLPSYPPGPGGTDRPAETAPMSGARMHPLPARAVRELLQIYVATTRAVGVVRTVVGEARIGRTKRHRTSGLFVPPPLSTARDRSRGSGDLAKSGEDDDDIKAEDQDCAQSRRGDKAGGFGEKARSAEEAREQPEELVDGCDDGDNSGSSDRDNSERNWARLAATPPSAVDVLPDTPIQRGDAGSGRLLMTGIEPGRQPHGSQSDVVDENKDVLARRANAASIEGLKLSNQSRSAVETDGRDGERSAVFTRRYNSTAELPIASSLRAPFHHKYAAVLAPPQSPAVPTTGAYNNSEGGGQSAGQRAGAGGKPKNPFAGASALILQLEAPNTTGKNSPRLGVVGNGGSYGSEGDGDKTVVDTTGDVGEGQRRIPPTVCGWRACLADASSGSLCATHLELKDFLDGKAAKNGGVSDAFRFLPPGSGPKRRSSLRKRRAAAAAAAVTTAGANSTAAQQSATAVPLSANAVAARNGEGELSVARSMSPLLSELLNGKLGKTIAMFCRRTAEESRVSRPRGPKPQAPPEWARWADPEEVKAADSRLDADTRWAEKVLRAEKEVTLELRRLCNLAIYPVAELAHIRREHDAMAKEWRQAVGGGGGAIEDGDGHYGGEEDEEGNSKNKAAPASFPAQPLPMMLPPSGTKQRRREPRIPSLAGYGATANSSHSPTPATRPGAASVGIEAFPLSTASGTGANARHGVPAAEKHPGGRRQRRKGSVGAGLALARGSTEGRVEERGASGSGNAGGRQDLTGSQGRSEQEIELEFSRLKWALFRRRRQEAEVSRAFARGHAPGQGQAIVPPLDATLPIFSAAGGRPRQHRRTREVAAGEGGSPADTPVKLPVSSPTTPSEQQLFQLARTTDKHGGGGGRRCQQQQQQQQQQTLVDLKKMQPFHQRPHS